MGKKKTLAIDGRMAAMIPYRDAYPKLGIIKGLDGRFTKMYRVGEIHTDSVAVYDSTAAEQAMEKLLNALPQDVHFQFVVHNRLIDDENDPYRYVLNPGMVPEELRKEALSYNQAVTENLEIGHNNTHKDLYYVVSVAATGEKAAEKRFKKLDHVIREAFRGLCGLSVKELTLVERLEVMYDMFHPCENKFGEKIDLSGNGRIDLKNLTYMRMTTKDLVAPGRWNTSRKWIDHSILEEGTPQQMYARALFLHSVPREVSSSFINDLTGISSQMILSITYEPVDTEAGFKESSDLVAENTVIRNRSVSDTVAERKRKARTRVEEEKEMSETAYFNKSALTVFKNAMARHSRAFACTITIVLFASDPEALDKDTCLMHLSAAKFSGNVQSLDLQQAEGFQSSLPLCQTRVNCMRVMDARRLAVMSPVGIQDAIRKNGMFLGLNAINDSLIMLNRRNNTNLTGFITGSDHPGKTYQMKREVFNALLGSQDILHVITAKDEYDDFAKKLGGEIQSFSQTPVYEAERGYGLLSGDEAFKNSFLAALAKQCAPSKLPDENAGTSIACTKRLVIHKTADAGEMLMLLDALWNLTLKDKHQGRSHQIFIDGADPLLTEPDTSEYLEILLKKCSQFQTITTLVIDNSVKLLGQPVSAIALERIAQGAGYIKLLNLGPIERRRYAEILNLPNALLPYISNVEPGKGIIVTPASNIAFNDNYTELYPDGSFKDLFAREVRQIGL
ncbi:MAG: hypothetical protein K5696_08005 [Lachnospiraceae bacterium]|nr:hypothetical protein [Lachnospiraceae bacterium]